MKITLLYVSDTLRANRGDWLLVRGQEIVGVLPASKTHTEFKLGSAASRTPSPDPALSKDALVALVERQPGRTTRQLCDALGAQDRSTRQQISWRLLRLAKKGKIQGLRSMSQPAFTWSPNRSAK